MKNHIFIGSYTGGKSQGIYCGVFENGQIAIQGVQEAVNPSYLTVHGDHLYAVEEAHDGAALSYAVNGLSLEPTGKQQTLGDDPCHVLSDGQWLYVSNYTSGSLTEFRLEGGNIVSPPTCIRHEGSSVNAERQSSAHVHQAVLTPDGRYLGVCDLGMDRVLFYPHDPAGIHTPPEEVCVPAGAGPRHAVFGPDGIWYVVCELTCDVLVYRIWEIGHAAAKALHIEGGGDGRLRGATDLAGRHVAGGNRTRGQYRGAIPCARGRKAGGMRAI